MKKQVSLKGCFLSLASIMMCFLLLTRYFLHNDETQEYEGSMGKMEESFAEENKIILKTELEPIEKKLPGVIIAGVNKCGTGALIEILKLHPHMAAPSYGMVEVKFWGNKDTELYQKGLEYYRDQMPLARADQTVVIKGLGLLNEMSLKRLYNAIPDIKLLLVVKNPIDRVVSDIVHEYTDGQLKGEHMPDIDDIIMGRTIIPHGETGDLLSKVLHLTNYTLHYQTMSAVFPKENILVVNGDKLVEDPLAELKRVEEFLELLPFYNENHFYYPDEDSKFPCFKLGHDKSCMHGDKGRQHPSLKRESLEFLEHHFQPMVDQLEGLTGVCLHGFMNKFDTDIKQN